MIDIQTIITSIHETFKKDQHRLKHTMGVYETARELAELYGVSAYDAAIASLCHDAMKNESLETQKTYLKGPIIKYYQETPVMYHALSAAEMIKKNYHVDDQDILDAIRFHVWGKPNMTPLGKIIFVSDYCEPNRTFSDVSIIKDLAIKDLDAAVFYCMKLTLDEVIANQQTPHQDQYLAYRYYREENYGKIK